MSAIAGVYDWRAGDAGPAVRKAMQALQRHGRDGEGFWDGGEIALGWRKTVLQREDFADVQPLTESSGVRRLVFDGRLDNRNELAEALQLSPERAREWPDSRYALAAFEKWAEQSPCYLLGDFAFVVWDGVKRELFLARDHVGSRPLVYCRRDGLFAFATSADGLFAAGAIARVIDEPALLGRLRHETPAPEATLFRNVLRLPGGHSATVSESALRIQQYWRLEGTPDIRFARHEEYVEALRERYERTVRNHLRTIHPVGSHLSSGWDSGSVTAVAASILAGDGRSLTAYTGVPAKGWTAGADRRHIFDEGPLAAEVAKRYSNIEHVRIPAPERLDFEAYDRLARCSGAPMGAVLNAGWYDLLHRTARGQGVRVMLVGSKGNLTISSDGTDRFASLLRHGRFGELAAEWSGSRRRGRSYAGLLYSTIRPFVPPNMMGAMLRLAGGQGTGWTGDVLRKTLPDRVGRGESRRIASRREFLTLACKRGHAETIGHTLAAWDIDSRDPTAAKQIVEFCYAIPDEQFHFRGEPRRLMRRLMTGVLPPATLDEKRRGLQAADYPAAIAASRDRLIAEADRLADRGALAALLDYGQIRRIVRCSIDTSSREQVQQLLSAIMADRFAGNDCAEEESKFVSALG